MKTRYFILWLAGLCLCSCNDWLREDGPMTNRVEDYFTSAETAVQVVNAAYVPLMWEYQGTYYSEFFIGDILSDDALKGGQNLADMSACYDLENFRAISNNEIVLQYYRAKYQGVARANLALEQVSQMEVDESLTQTLKDRLLGEAYFLRANYYFSLVRLYGGVPLVTSPIYSAGNWKQPRASVGEVYAQIFSDLQKAESLLLNKSALSAEDLGRVTKGAAQAMLLKANLYYADYLRNSGADGSNYYSDAYAAGKRFLSEQAGEYSLCPDYADNFTLEGENGPESIFEVQYMAEGTSDYGEGNGFSRGTFATILLRSRSNAFSSVGWGFNHPTQNLIDEFEAGDHRLASCVYTPSSDQIVNPVEESYLGNPNLCVKRALMQGSDYMVLEDSHDSRSPINMIVIRLADVYLLYAEAALRSGELSDAKLYLEKVRERARGSEDILPAFPAYKLPDYTNAYALHQLQDNSEDLMMAIMHERRVELAMESHRWYDLCRWGIVSEVMNAYAAAESEEVRAHISPFVKGKHELLPIPVEEVRLGGIEQNPNY